jgi:Uma2 family endonuclease
MPVTVQTFEQLALEDSETKWELVCGKLREKPGMTQEHNEVAWWLGYMLQTQLDRGQFHVRVDAGYARRSDENVFSPDVMVIPVDLMAALRGTGKLEAYDAPLPFVAEVWSPSTGSYDVDTKFPEYRRRGDLEIWRLHPYEETVIAWRRQPDGSYSETHYASGDVEVASLPGVVIRLESLFQ